MGVVVEPDRLRAFLYHCVNKPNCVLGLDMSNKSINLILGFFSFWLPSSSMRSM